MLSGTNTLLDSLFYKNKNSFMLQYIHLGIKKTSKRRFAGNATKNGFIIAILKSPFQTREAITFPF
jgi:hypothetical protein